MMISTFLFGEGTDKFKKYLIKGHEITQQMGSGHVWLRGYSARLPSSPGPSADIAPCSSPGT